MGGNFLPMTFFAYAGILIGEKMDMNTTNELTQLN
jgi:hypothetical protein